MTQVDKILELIVKLGEKLAEYAKKITLPFFDGVPVYDVGLFFWHSIDKGAITTRASAIAFSFFLAFFPFVIFIFTLIPYIPIQNFQFELLTLIQNVVPKVTYAAIENTVTEIILRPRGDLLSFGFFTALIFSTNGFASMMTAFDATVHSIKRRNWLSQRITAIYLLIINSVMLALVIVFITLGEKFIQYLQETLSLHDFLTTILLYAIKWAIVISLLFFSISFLYYMAPAKRGKWRFISAGGTLATILTIILLIGFTRYINRFNQYNQIYGSIGTLLIILLLMYLMSLVLLIGFELNASIHQAHAKNRKKIRDNYIKQKIEDV